MVFTSNTLIPPLLPPSAQSKKKVIKLPTLGAEIQFVANPSFCLAPPLREADNVFSQGGKTR